MAALSGQLNSPSAGKSILQPVSPAVTSSPFGALAGLVSKGSNILGDLDEKQQRKEVTDAKNAVVDGIWGDIKSNRAQQDTPVNPEISSAADQVSKVRTAVDQGKAPQAALDVKLEATFDTLLRKFPDQKAMIYGQFQQMGFDHYLIRGEEANSKAMDAAETERVAGEEAQYSKGIHYGATGTRDEIMATGRKFLQQEAVLDFQKKQLDAVKTQQDISETERKRNLEVAQREGSTEVLKLGENMFAPATQQFLSLVAAAQSDPKNSDKKIETLEGLGPVAMSGLDNMGLVMHNKLYEMGVTDQSEHEKVDSWIKTKKAAFQETFTGTFSEWQQKKRAWDTISSTLNIDAAKSFPILSKLSRAMGPAAINGLFPLNTAMSDPMKAALMKETAGVNFAEDTPEVNNHIAHIALILQGQLGLKDIKPSEVQTVVPDLFRAVRGNRDAILSSPEPDEKSKQGFIAGTANLSEASMAMNPGNATLATLEAATGLTDYRTRAAMAKLVKDPIYGEEGRALIISTRAAAAHNLEVGKRVLPMENGAFTAKFNGRTGKYEVVSDPKKLRSTVGAMSMDGSAPMDGGLSQMNADKRLNDNDRSRSQTAADVLNANLDHLDQTAQYDDNVASMTSSERRAYYAEGKVPANMKDKSEDLDKTFSSGVETLRNTLTSIPNTLATNPDTEVTNTVTSPRELRSAFVSDQDALIKTALAEAAGESDKGLAEVMKVILNRSKKTGNSIVDEVLKPGQFEPWTGDNAAPRNKWGKIDPSSEQYQRALKILQSITDTGSNTQFYSPGLQNKLGRNTPSWDDGTGVDIGNHRFFAHPYG